MNIRIPIIIVSTFLTLMIGVSGSAQAQDSSNSKQQSIEINEWAVPWEETRPRDPDVAADGSVWFVGQIGDYVGHFVPETEDFSKVDLPDGSGPHNVIVGGDGMLWIAGNKQAYVGLMNPKNGALQRFPTAEPQVKDPHTLVWSDDDKIWFTAQWGNTINRLDPESGKVNTVEVSTEEARPYGIILRENLPWVVLLGTNKLATVDSNMRLREIELPRADARPRRIGKTSDGRIWYVDYNQGYLGVYDVDSGEFLEWRAPGADKSGPYAMAVDGADRIWFVETFQSPNRLIGFDPKTETFFSQTDIPSGGGSVRHMVFDAPRNALWFGTDTNNLARAELPQ